MCIFQLIWGLKGYQKIYGALEIRNCKSTNGGNKILRYLNEHMIRSHGRK
jgi:hypothetical protein